MLRRLKRFIDYLNYRGFMLVGTTYLAAASLIGFETLAVILGYATAFPVAAPALVIGIGVWVLVRRWMAHSRGRSEHARLLLHPRELGTTAPTDGRAHERDSDLEEKSS